MTKKDKPVMSFLEHLEALRWHLIRGLSVLLLLTVTLFLFKRLLFYVILAPSRVDFYTYKHLCHLAEYVQIKALCIDDLPFIMQSRRMAGQFSMHIMASLVGGLVLSFPYLFWEFWRFIRPGLKKNEANAVRGLTGWAGILFFIGVLFGYFVLTPISINFLSHYQVDPAIRNQFDITSYVSTVSLLVLSSGTVFLLPIVVYFLKKATLITAKDLTRRRKYAIVAIFVVSAMITPPDPFSQMLLVLPLLALYEISILVAKHIK